MSRYDLVALLKAIHEAQQQFIEEPNDQQAFDILLGHLLHLTQSEYGFIGEVLKGDDDQPYLKCHSISNIAWNEETQRLFEEQNAAGLEFHNLQTLFGHVITTESALVCNDPKSHQASAGTPDGHPPLDAFLGLPIRHTGKMIGMIGVANRCGGYSDEVVSYLQPFLTACGVLIHARRTESQRREFESQRQHRQRLESMMHMAGQLAHDLNNILTAILTTADIEARRAICDDLKQSFELIRSAAMQAGELSQQMLDYSGNSIAKQKPLNANSLIRDVVEIIERIGNHAESFILDLSPSDPQIHGDAVALKQVIRNIALNAIEAADPTSPQVSISTTTIETRESPTVAIRIRDNGRGIPTEVSERVFDPYFTTKARGRGLGLSTAHGIIHAHNGSIQFDTTKEGTTFEVILPRSDVLASNLETTAVQPHDSGTVLIVDDDEGVLRVLERALDHLGFRSLKATSGERAVVVATSAVFDCAIIDIQMPGIDGFETMERLRQIHPNLPVILSTGFTNRSLPENLDSTHLLKKPYTLSDLSRMLGGALSIRLNAE